MAFNHRQRPESKKKVREMAHTMTRGEPIFTTDAIYDHWKETFCKTVAKTFPEFQKTTAYGRYSFTAPDGWFVVFREGYNSGYSMLIISKNGRTLEMWEGLEEDDFQEDLADLLSVTYQYVKDYTNPVKESHIKTKHIKESIVEDGIASFLKWLREENFITPIEERDFMNYLKRGEIEEQDVDIIYDIGTDYDPEHESNENFEKCANIVKSYVGQSGLQYCSKKTNKARRVQEGFHGHTFKINWEMLDQEGSDRLTDLLIDAVAWKNEDEDYKTQEKFELTFNRKFEELKKRGMSSNEAAPKASNYALFTILPRDDEEASNIINDYLFSGACRDEEDENLLRSFVSDEGEESKPDQGLPTDKYDLGLWADPAYESRKRSKIRESVTKDTHHCFRVFNMHPDVAEKLESLAEEEPDWLVQFTPKDKNYFLLTTSEVKSKDQLRKLIDVEASYQAQLLF